jgi:hypothetical protein
MCNISLDGNQRFSQLPKFEALKQEAIEGSFQFINF